MSLPQIVALEGQAFPPREELAPRPRNGAPRVVCLLLIAFLSLSTISASQTLSGSVKNGTTNRPVAGDEVVLLKLAQGMEEGGRTKTDAKGSFSFKLDDAGSPHLIRVIHQGVTYHMMAPPGTPSVDIQIYDVAKKVDEISVTANVMRFQAQHNELQGIRLFAVDNHSSPPRTQMNDQNFEFYLPEGAQIDTGMAKTANGQPINSAPVPQKEKNRYAFIFPLRPGETQFQVVFHLPYSGSANIDPKALYGAQHFVVMLPKTMKFSSASAASFQQMTDPNNSDSQVQVASNTTAGQALSFKISGTGVLQAQEGGGPPGGGAQSAGEAGPGQPAEGMPTAQGRDSRPGGGLGPPIDAPDPLEQYKWYILGGFAAVLAIGAFFITNRSKTATMPDYAPSDIEIAPLAAAARPTGVSRPSMLLEALKEELFQLELERRQGRVTPEEYEKAKAALDQTLDRALKRQS